MSECLSLSLLENLTRDGSEPSAARQHVDTCPRCARRLAEVQRNEQFLGALGDGPRPGLVERDFAAPGYSILSEIHRGAQGAVYRSIQETTRREVALKVLHDGAFASPAKRRRFERETEIVAQLSHRGIVTLHDSGIDQQGRPYLVMELVDGVSLDEHFSVLRERASSTREILRLVVRVCDAVNYAHQHGVIHRDLKPSNILVDAEGMPKVLDFGLAKGVDDLEADRAPVTLTGQFLGTLAFASPEQVSGESGLVDTRSDVYALGVILYRGLTGQFPYRVDGSVAEVVSAITQDAPAFPTGATSTERIDRDLETISIKALAKDPSRRYQTAGELGRDLERYLHGHPIEARRDSAWYVLRKALRRHRIAVGVVVVIFVALATATIISVTSWRRAQADATRAQELNLFFEGLFASIDPDVARGRDISVRELVGEAERRLLDQGFDDPEVEFSLRWNLARAFSSLSLPARARPHTERALELSRHLDGAGGRRPTSCALELVGVCVGLGDLERAEQLLAEVEPHLGQDPALRAAYASRLAALRTIRGRYADSLAMLDQALQSTVGLADAGRFSLMRQQGLVLTASGQLRRAESVFRELLEQTERDAPRSGDHLIALQQCAELAFRRGNFAGAALDARRALALSDSLFGAHHAQTLRCAAHLVLALERGGQAIPATLERRLGEMPQHLGDTAVAAAAFAWSFLGQIAAHRGDLAEAERAMRRAMAVFESLTGSHSPAISVVLHNLGQLLFGRGDHAAAEVAFTESLELRTRFEPEGHLGIPLTKIELAVVLVHRDRPEEALALLDGLPARLSDPATASYRQGLLLKGHGRVLYQLGRYAEARPVLEMAHAVLRHRVGDTHRQTVWTKSMLANCLDYTGHADAALGMYREAIDAFVAGEVSPRSDLARMQNDYGVLLAKRGDVVAGRQLLVAAVANYRSDARTPVDRLARALLNLSATYQLTHDDEAREEALRSAWATCSALEPQHPARTSVRAALEALLQERAAYTELVPLQQETVNACRLEYGPDDERTQQAIARLRDLEARARSRD